MLFTFIFSINAYFFMKPYFKCILRRLSFFHLLENQCHILPLFSNITFKEFTENGLSLREEAIQRLEIKNNASKNCGTLFFSKL